MCVLKMDHLRHGSKWSIHCLAMWVLGLGNTCVMVSKRFNTKSQYNNAMSIMTLQITGNLTVHSTTYSNKGNNISKLQALWEGYPLFLRVSTSDWRFPSQRANDMEKVSMSYKHHVADPLWSNTTRVTTPLYRRSLILCFFFPNTIFQTKH